MVAFYLAAGFPWTAALAAEQYGNWIVQASGRFVAAFTSDRQGSTLGVGCDGRECIFYVDNGPVCEDGAEYFGLLNAASGAAHVTFECKSLANSPAGTHVYAATRFELLEEAVRTQSIVSIVLPLADGTFRVTRFDAGGYAGAEAAMRALLRPRK